MTAAAAGRSRSPSAVLRAVDRRVVAPGPARRFTAVRMGLTVVLGVRLALRRWTAAADQPAELFDPAFVVAWLPRPPGAAVLVAAQVLGLLAAALSVVSTVRPVGGGGRGLGRVGFVGAWLSLLFLAGVWSGSGKVLHNDVLLLLACVPFVLARTPPAHPPGRPGAADRSVAAGWPPRAALVIIASVYAVAGLQKLRHGGLAWVTSDNLRWVLRDGANGSSSPFPSLAADLASSPVAARALAAGALAVELSAPLLLARARTRPVFVALAALLHGGIWLTLGLDYYGWVLTVAVVALPGATAPHADAAPVVDPAGRGDRAAGHVQPSRSDPRRVARRSIRNRRGPARCARAWRPCSWPSWRRGPSRRAW